MSFLESIDRSLTGDIAAVDNGSVVVRSLATANRDEVALVGLVRIGVPRDFYFDRTAHVPAFLAQPGRERFGVLRTPPIAADFAAIRLDPSEAAGVRKCQISHCSLKLPAQEMAAIANVLDQPREGSIPANALVDSLVRSWLLGVVTDYVARGDAALPVYDDTRPTEQSASGFRELLGEDAALFRDAPTFAAYLSDSPARSIAGGASTLYWAIDRRPGLKPILSVSQLSTFHGTGANAPMLIATKQLYASHYFDSWLDVESLHDGSSSEASTYVVLVRRVMFDRLPSRGLFDVRGRVVRKLRDALRDELTRTRSTVEAAYAER